MKIGDELQLVHKEDDLKRIVVGFLSNGEVVYEFDAGRAGPTCASRSVSEVKVIVPKKKGWLNVYDYRHSTHFGTALGYCYIYATKELADKAAGSDRLDCIEVEYNAEAR